MTTRTRGVLAVVTWMLAVPIVAQGQERLAPVVISATPDDHGPGTGVVHGLVRGPDGRGLANALVRLGQRELRTAENGVFVFSHVEPGEYTLQARAVGHFGYFAWVGVSAGRSDPLVIEAQPAPAVPVVARRAGDDRARFLAATPRFWNPVTFEAPTLTRVRAASVTAWLDDLNLVEPGGLTTNPVRILDTAWASIGHVVVGGGDLPTTWASTLLSSRQPRPPLPAFAAVSGTATAAWGLRARNGGLDLGSTRIATPVSEMVPSVRGPDAVAASQLMPLGDGPLLHSSWCSGIQTFLNGRAMPAWVLDAVVPSDFDIIDVAPQERPDGPCTIVALWTRPGASSPPPAPLRR